ncbi:hypothetical protein DIE23_14160 [Burkholderia sp. Bp9143]|uniref:YadA-like family protein n=1 Tax=Burkholderia sp. Bp9143 TaxID=2184574 RepID=UPI000F5B681F|nr:YadA-like family protein [Burkholderia sp. Bp9143]RQR33343.1 hypothetical protein DIE23_14160 [Burkholderia sp. Bp9143]
MQRNQISALVAAMFASAGVLVAGAAHADNFVDRGNPDNALNGQCIDGTNPLCVATKSGAFVATSSTNFTSGANAKAGSSGIAIGDQSNAGSQGGSGSGGGIAIGVGAQALANSATAIGTVAVAQGNTALAMGRQSAAIGDYSMAFGNVADAHGTSSIALGHSALASGDRSIAIGGANPTTSDGVSNGASYDAATQTRAGGTQSVAIGAGAQTNDNNQIAIGSGSVGANNGGTPVFGGTAAPVGGAVSFGSLGHERQIRNVAAGAADTDAVNVQQLKNVNSTLSTGIANVDARVTSVGNTLSTSIANVDQRVTSVGNSLSTSIVAATQNVVKYTDDTHAAIALDGSNGTTISGVAAGVADTDAVNVGQLGKATDTLNQSITNVGNSVTKLGDQVTTNTGNIAALRQDALQWNASLGTYDASHGGNAPQRIGNLAAGQNGTDAVNVDQLNAAIHDGTSQLDALAVKYDDASKRQVSLGAGNGGVPVRVTNVAEGGVSAGSTDAVNGGQLYGVKSDLEQQITQVSNQAGEAVKNVVKYDVDGNGNRLNSVSLVGGNPNAAVVLKNVAAGTDDTDAVNVKQLKSVQSNLDQLGALAVQYDDASKRSITLGGAGGTRITNVKAGTLGATSTDAVNGSQLYATNQQVSKNTTDIANLQSNVTNIANGKAGLVQQQDPNGAITVGKDSGGTSVNFSGTAGDRVLTGVAAGVNANDAVNMAQFNDALKTAAANDQVRAAATDANATWIARADAGSIGSTATATGKNAVAVGQGSVADRDNSFSVGAKGSERQVTNVAAGTAPTDAVNVQQLNDNLNTASTQAKGYTDQRIGQVYNAFSDLKKDIYGGVASAMAVAGLPQPTGAGRSMVSAATSNYHGQQGFAAGYSYVTESNRWVVKASVTGNARSDFGAVVGAGYQF